MRYALYFTPEPDDALTLAAQSWLGRDAFTGQDVPPLAFAGLPAGELHALTAEPRRYGFHATLVAPFRLRAGLDVDAVTEAAADFAAGCRPFVIPQFSISLIDGFFALTPSRADEVSALASAAVDHFNGLRAPLAPAEIERRRPELLTQRQRACLERYGYPYVKEGFRFHMTLTGPLAPETAARVEPALRHHFAGLPGRPVEFAAVTLFAEPGAGADFTVHSTYRFDTEAARKSA